MSSNAAARIQCFPACFPARAARNGTRTASHTGVQRRVAAVRCARSLIARVVEDGDVVRSLGRVGESANGRRSRGAQGERVKRV